MPAPPNSSSTVTPSKPISPNLNAQMIGELVISVDICGDGGDMLGGERVDVVSEHIDGFTKPKVEWGVAAFHNISLLKVLRFLGSVDLSRLNFVRDKIVLGEARSVPPSYSKQILLNKA